MVKKGFVVERSFPEMYSLDPPRGVPSGAAALPARMGIWGNQLPSSCPALLHFSGKVQVMNQRFQKMSESEAGHFF
jgi:hypothetical protein